MYGEKEEGKQGPNGRGSEVQQEIQEEARCFKLELFWNDHGIGKEAGCLCALGSESNQTVHDVVQKRNNIKSKQPKSMII